jgi:hypothetical protein
MNWRLAVSSGCPGEPTTSFTKGGAPPTGLAVPAGFGCSTCSWGLVARSGANTGILLRPQESRGADARAHGLASSASFSRWPSIGRSLGVERSSASLLVGLAAGVACVFATRDANIAAPSPARCMKRKNSPVGRIAESGRAGKELLVRQPEIEGHHSRFILQVGRSLTGGKADGVVEGFIISTMGHRWRFPPSRGPSLIEVEFAVGRPS